MTKQQTIALRLYVLRMRHLRLATSSGDAWHLHAAHRIVERMQQLVA